jgi:hypothetical protein
MRFLSNSAPVQAIKARDPFAPDQAHRSTESESLQARRRREFLVAMHRDAKAGDVLPPIDQEDER